MKIQQTIYKNCYTNVFLYFVCNSCNSCIRLFLLFLLFNVYLFFFLLKKKIVTSVKVREKRTIITEISLTLFVFAEQEKVE